MLEPILIYCKCYIWNKFIFIDEKEMLECILVKQKYEMHLFTCKLQLFCPEI